MCWDAMTPPHHPVMRGLAHNRWRRRPPFGGVFAGVVLRRVWPVLLARRGVCPPRRRLCPRPPYLSVGGGFGRPGPQSKLRRRWAALRGPPPPRFGFGGSVAAASRGVVRWLSLPVGGWGALPSSGRGRGVPQRADRDDLRWARPPGASPSPPLGDSAACGRRGKTGPHGGPEERSDPLRPRCARPPLPRGEARDTAQTVHQAVIPLCLFTVSYSALVLDGIKVVIRRVRPGASSAGRSSPPLSPVGSAASAPRPRSRGAAAFRRRRSRPRCRKTPAPA